MSFMDTALNAATDCSHTLWKVGDHFQSLCQTHVVSMDKTLTPLDVVDWELHYSMLQQNHSTANRMSASHVTP